MKPVYPGRTWQRKPPAEVGMDPAMLDAFARYTGGRGCVVRYGYLVYTWGDYRRRGDVASACKPFYTYFLFKALEEGKITSLDERVVRWEKRLATLNRDLGFKDRLITWRHLANQVSCYGVRERPGEAFDYSDYQMALFFDTLFLKVYGSKWKTVDEDVLRPMLTEPLQCEDDPTLMVFGTGDRPGRVGISPRDFCRFGLLYLRGGRWRGRQLISAEHARTATTSPLPATLPRTRGGRAEMIPRQRSVGGGNNQCDHRGGYSFAWWVNGLDRKGKRLWPGMPADAYGAFGHGGPRAMAVMPSLDLVVSWNDARLRGWDKVGKALKLLAAAVSRPTTAPAAVPPGEPASGPLPGQVVVDPENPAWLVRFDPRGRHKPFFMCGPGDPEDFLYRGRRNPDGTRSGDQADIIRKLAAAGANCIYLQAVRSHGGDGDPTHNPFIDNDPAKSLNQRVLDQWEEWFAELDRRGIVVFFIIYDDSASIWNTGDRVGPAEERFIRALVRRFQHHGNLVWCVAEEYQEAYSRKRASRIAAVIRAADRRRHPVAVHQLNGLTFDFPDDPAVDQFAVQYNVSDPGALHAGLVRAFRAARGRYNLNLAECRGFGTGAALRRKLWAAATAGAYVMVLGMDVASTPAGDLEDCGRVVRFFELADPRGMAPHDELAAGDTAYVLARPGRRYVLYGPDVRRGLGLKKLPPAAYRALWLDCASGRSEERRLVHAGGGALWKKPPGFGAECALYLARRGADGE